MLPQLTTVAMPSLTVTPLGVVPVSDKGAVGHVGGVGDVHLQESSGGKVADHEEVALSTFLTAHAVQKSGAGGRQRAQFLAGHNVVGADDVVLDDKQGASQNFHAVAPPLPARSTTLQNRSRQNAASVAPNHRSLLGSYSAASTEVGVWACAWAHIHVAIKEG